MSQAVIQENKIGELQAIKNVISYIRVSDEEQARFGLSLPGQRKLYKNLVEKEGYTMLKEFADEGRSAYNESLKRKGLQEMMTYITENQGKVDALILQDTSRLSRDTQVYFQIRAFLKQADVKLISISQPMLDESPEGKLIDTIFAGINQFHSDNDSVKVKAALQEKFEQGWYPGHAKYGYKNVVLEQGSNRRRTNIGKDEERWGFIKQAFRMYLSGNYSVIEIRDTLHKRGLCTWKGDRIAHSTMSRILQDSFYAGIMRFNKQEKVGLHDTMITLKEHKRVLEIMEAHGQHASRRRIHDFLLRGFVYCGICGNRLVGEIHPEKKKAYYRCPSKKDKENKHSGEGQYAEVDSLQEQIANSFHLISFTKETIDTLITTLKNRRDKRIGEIESEKKILQTRKANLEKKRVTVEEKLMTGVLSDDDYGRMRDRIQDEMHSVDEEIETLEGKRDIDMETVRKLLLLAKDVPAAYKKANPELKRIYLGLFWEKFMVQDKKIVEAIPTKFFRALLENGKIRWDARTTKSPQPLRPFFKLKFWVTHRRVRTMVVFLVE